MSLLQNGYNLAIYYSIGNSSNVPVKRMSVSEMIKSKSVVDLLKYQSELRSTILQC